MTPEEKAAQEVAVRLTGSKFYVSQRVRITMPDYAGYEARIIGFNNGNIMVDPDPLPNEPGGWNPNWLEPSE